MATNNYTEHEIDFLFSTAENWDEYVKETEDKIEDTNEKEEPKKSVKIPKWRPNFFVNSKYSVEAYNTLHQIDLFKENDRLFLNVMYFLGFINSAIQTKNNCNRCLFSAGGELLENTKDNKLLSYQKSTTYDRFPDSKQKESYFVKCVEIPWGIIEQLLTRDHRHEIIRILEDLQWIKHDPTYTKSLNSKSYMITDIGFKMLADIQKDYFKNLITDKQSIQKVQKSVSESGYNKMVFDSGIQANFKNTVDTIKNFEELLEVVETLETETKKAHAVSLLIKIRCKLSSDFEFNDITGRCYSLYHQLPKQLKRHIRYKGKLPIASLDVRSCISTFFGKYIKSLSLNTDLKFNASKLDAEIEVYQSIFTDTLIHPRQYIAEELKLMTGKSYDDSNIKSMLNKALNGCNSLDCKVYRKWIETRFPVMYMIWNDTSLDETGSTISSKYEFEIFRSEEVFELATECGIKFCDNHDEIFIYGTTAKAREFILKFKERSNHILELQVPFSMEWYK